jgi:predicted nucleic acid-binding protein
VICYLDTSALVPLLVAEPGTARARELWERAAGLASCRLVYVETAAALAQAHRMGRLDATAHDTAAKLLDRLYDDLDIVVIDDHLVRRAAALAVQFALRGYDAVHCAAAERLAAPDLVAASGDRRLLEAWQGLGIATADTSPSG